MTIQYYCSCCNKSLLIQINEQEYQKSQQKYKQEMQEYKTKSLSTPPINPSVYYKPENWEQVGNKLLCFNCLKNKDKENKTTDNIKNKLENEVKMDLATAKEIADAIKYAANKNAESTQNMVKVLDKLADAINEISKGVKDIGFAKKMYRC